ncbi:aminoglycoside phosphotransferase family protein [Paenibacillus allorhizosphaerae]|uniref:Aminoglycoside phosphotransferase domain-containing protein n=1 Tax=Paenibacillus allorhizosphaerae TaxID=2849866 RepID=A0ABM8VKY1_9BACL|nr:aminoglycoside phosphotransferase family protein [Paenibacillus allorhizosphaerae]CAG7647677.1 hypothetical protein PAECIP111802_04037 [Paenibacillus allorhizosphaerae]
MNLNHDDLQTLGMTELTKVVQTMFDDESVQVETWTSKPLQGGTVGLVYEVCGTCSRSRTHESAATDGAGEPVRSVKEPSAGREPGHNWAAVLKIQKPFARFGDPESWRREMRLYQSDVYDYLPRAVKVPRCYRIEEKDGTIWMWMEKMTGRNGTQLSLDDYALIARHLAHFQGAFVTGKPLPSQPWLSTQYWLVHTSADWATRAIPWLEPNGERQKDPLLSEETVRDAQWLWVERDRLLDVFHTLPRTLCHRDFSAGNVFTSKDARGMEQTAVIDWDCAGIGRVGEDIADLVGEALIFYDFEPAQAALLQETVLSSYISGLREANWKGDERLIRQGYAISFTLHWCFRIASRIRKLEDREARQRYASVLSFVAGQAAPMRDMMA